MERAVIHVNPRHCQPVFPVLVRYLDSGETGNYANIREFCEDIEDLDTTDQEFNDVRVESPGGHKVRVVLHLGNLILFQLDPEGLARIVRYRSHSDLHDGILVEYFNDVALRATTLRSAPSRRRRGSGQPQHQPGSFPVAWNSEHYLESTSSYVENAGDPESFEELWWAQRR